CRRTGSTPPRLRQPARLRRSSFAAPPPWPRWRWWHRARRRAARSASCGGLRVWWGAGVSRVAALVVIFGVERTGLQPLLLQPAHHHRLVAVGDDHAARAGRGDRALQPRPV